MKLLLVMTFLFRQAFSGSPSVQIGRLLDFWRPATVFVLFACSVPLCILISLPPLHALISSPFTVGLSPPSLDAAVGKERPPDCSSVDAVSGLLTCFLEFQQASQQQQPAG